MGERILVTGVQVAWSYGDLDGDGYDEIVTMPGPDPDQPAHLRAWNVDGAAVAVMDLFDTDVYGDLGLVHGGTVAGGRLH